MTLHYALGLARRRYEARVPDFKRQLEFDLASIRERAAAMNTLNSSGTVAQFFARCSQEVKQRIHAAWGDCRNAVQTAGVRVTPDLPAQLREHVRAVTQVIVSGQELRNPPGNPGVALNIEDPYREALDEVDAEVELFAVSVERNGGKPVVFISHIAEDGDIALALKTLIQTASRDRLAVFVSSDYESIRSGTEWHGAILKAIGEARALIALLSEESYQRPWINYEVGAGDVQEKLVIPAVIRGFAKSQLRPPLARRHARSLLVGGEVQALVVDLLTALQVEPGSLEPGDILDLIAKSSRPTVAKGSSELAMRVARLLCERSEHGTDCDPILEVSDIADTLDLPLTDIELIVDELTELGWVVTHGDFNSSIGIGSIMPTLHLFLSLDPIVKGWDPIEDSNQLLQQIGKEPHAADGFLLSSISGSLPWEPRRLNVAARLLSEQGLIASYDTMGCSPYAFRDARLLPKGRRAL